MPTDRSTLRADCADCSALCCTLLGFQRSADFPIDKPAGTPCHNLAGDFSCTIHEVLRPRGFRGCTVFDCFGAGQSVSRTLFDGISWRGRPETAREMSAVFAVVRRLHEMLWYLADAVDRAVTPDAAEDAEALRDRIRTTIDAGSSSLRRLDVEALHTEVRDLLVEVSQEVRTITRAGATPDAAFCPGVDLAGLDLRGRDLRGRDLRGASAIAADLRRVDLTDTDLLGVDLRDALVHGADLSAALFLTQSQVNAMSGDGDTSLPRWIERPRHWSPSA